MLRSPHVDTLNGAQLTRAPARLPPRRDTFAIHKKIRARPFTTARVKRIQPAFAVFNRLLPFVWPNDRPDLRRRVVLAGLVLVAAKLVTVADAARL